MFCESAVSRVVKTLLCYLVCVTWSNVVNIMVGLVFVDNGLEMWLINFFESIYWFGYLVIHTI